MIPTHDPHTFIEEQRPGYVRYLSVADGRRWEVIGACDRRGHCMVGAVVNGVQIRSVEHLAELCAAAGKDRIDSDLDVPVGPGFRGCCPLEIVEL